MLVEREVLPSLKGNKNFFQACMSHRCSEKTSGHGKDIFTKINIIWRIIDIFSKRFKFCQVK